MMKSVGSKIPDEQYARLRWLAWRKNTTRSAIIAAYIEMGLQLELALRDFPGDDDATYSVRDAAGDTLRLPGED